jgi:hypothetical protein
MVNRAKMYLYQLTCVCPPMITFYKGGTTGRSTSSRTACTGLAEDWRFGRSPGVRSRRHIGSSVCAVGFRFRCFGRWHQGSLGLKGSSPSYGCEPSCAHCRYTQQLSRALCTVSTHSYVCRIPGYSAREYRLWASHPTAPPTSLCRSIFRW